MIGGTGARNWGARKRGPSGAEASKLPIMANKAPPSGQNKKQGKSLLEKRAAKKTKKAEKSKRGTT